MRKTHLLIRLLLACLVCVFACHAQALESALTFTTAEISLEENNSQANHAHQWKKVALPDLWKYTHPDFVGSAWYRFKFDINDDQHQIQAVYLPRLSMNAEVFINGSKIGDGGNMHEPVSRNWNRPLLFVISPQLLKAKQNTLLIKVVAPAYTQGMLYPPEIARLNTLQQQYDQAMFVRITLNQAAGLFIVGIGILMLNLWWRRRQDVAYGLFGLAALVWAAQSLNFYITKPLFSTAFWEVFVNSSFEAITAFWLISLLGFSGIQARIFSIWLLSLMVVSVALRAIAPAPYFMQINDITHFLTISSVLVGLLYLARAWLLHGNKDAKLILATLSVILLFAVHDWMIHTKIEWLNAMLWGSKEYMMQFSAPVLFLIVGLMMTSRYVGAINSFEVLNQELEQRVDAKRQELDQNFSQLQTMLKEQATLEERERIYQDLHDDLGAKLLTLVYRAQNDHNAELARSALQDLRDVVSRAGTDMIPLADAMADYRVECEKRLSDVKIKLVWDHQIDDNSLTLTQPQVLNLGRIIREAVSNVIRHAKANKVHISLQVNQDKLTLTLADNGIGIPANMDPSKGRGLGNIQKRAILLGGEVHLLPSQPSGLTLRLSIPCTAFQHPSSTRI